MKQKIQICLIHPSYQKNLEFQRLEFLGDKVISFYLAKYLMLNYNLSEGEMTVKISQMVNNTDMAFVGSFLKDQIKYSGELNNSIIADCLEAWFGYKLLNGDDVEFLIYDLWQDYLSPDIQINPKNQLQEIMQKQQKTIKYIYIQENNNFLVQLIADNKIIKSIGKSKKIASINAAQIFLNKYLYLY